MIKNEQGGKERKVTREREKERAEQKNDEKKRKSRRAWELLYVCDK